MKPILIVDDELAIVETLVEILSWEGYSAMTASNGQMGLAQARATRPALILLDYMMPVMDGVQMLSVLRSDDLLAATPVAMMTAAPLGIPAVDKTWDALLLKPFESEELLRVIRRLIGPPP
jgi:CheY-like chemotaxis protein